MASQNTKAFPEADDDHTNTALLSAPTAENAKDPQNEEPLVTKLYEACKAWDQVQSRIPWFLPRNMLEELITPRSISKELYGTDGLSPSSNRLLAANKYHRVASKLFALLVLIGKGDSISSFVNEDLTDKDLPFTRASGTVPLSRGKVRLHPLLQPHRTIQAWKDGYLPISNGLMTSSGLF